MTLREISDALEQFQLGEQGQPRKKFWSVAHQKAAYSIPQMLDVLSPQNRAEITVRNCMEYRYLGLLRIEDSQVIDTSVGLAFLADQELKQQEIIDCQIAKFWLANPTNRLSKIDVFPLFVIGQVLLSVKYLTWEEYLMVVIWVQRHSEVQEAIQLVSMLRAISSDERLVAMQETQDRSSSKDIGDQARRPWKIVANHSLIRLDGPHTIWLATSNEEASKYLDSVAASIPKSLDQYEDFLVTERNISPIVISKSAIDGGLDFKEVLLKPKPDVETDPHPVARNPVKVDYEALQKAKSKSGEEAEEYVVATERAKLRSQGLLELANKVKRVSLLDDGLGFDVISFYEDGAEKHIEVKSVSKLAGTCSIFITSNEVRTAQRDKNWLLYVVMGNGSTKPYIWNSNELAQAITDLNVDAEKLAEDIYVSSPQLELTFYVIGTQSIE